MQNRKLFGLSAEGAESLRKSYAGVLTAQTGPAKEKAIAELQKKLSGEAEGGKWKSNGFIEDADAFGRVGLGALRVMGAVASGISLASSISDWGQASGAEKLQTVWSGFDLGADVLSYTASVFSKPAVGTALGKITGPVGGVISAVTGTASTLAAIEAGDARGAVTGGLSTIGGVLMSVPNPVTFLVGVGFQVASIAVNDVWGSIETGQSEDEVKDALIDAGVEPHIAELLKRQTDHEVGVGAVFERIAEQLGIRSDQLIAHLNTIPSDDEKRLEALEELIGHDESGVLDVRKGGIIGKIHDLRTDENSDGTSRISNEQIHEWAQYMQENGLAPS